MASLHISKDPRWAGNISFHTYIVLQEKYPAASLDAKFPELVKNNLGPQLQAGLGISYEQMVAAGGRYRLSLQPLTDIHLRSHLEFEIEPNSNIAYVYIFSAIAVLILLIACINFMNLATARSAHRAKEVGVRKVLGSNRVQLVSQFLSESMLLTFVALLFALALVELLLPVFNQLSGKQIETNYFGSGILLPSLIGLALLLGMMAGSYPAFFLASFQPLAVIRGKPGAALPGAKKFRSSLVVFQFTISIALIVATIVVHDQWVTPEIKIWASTRSM
jgi:putative ABC transport system permease protein